MARKNIIEILIKADDKASKKFRVINVNTQELGRRVAGAAKIMAAAGVAAGVALTAIISKTAAWGDKIAKSAKKIGVTTEFLSEMEHAAKISGATVDDFLVGIKRMSKAASDANYGLETYKRSFDALGISVTDNNGNLKDSEILFYEVAEAISKIENDTQKAALAQELFGRGGLNLIPMMNRGRAGIRELRLEAKRLGVSLAGEDAEKMEEFQDAVTNIKDAMQGVAIAITTDYGPAITRVLNKMADFISDYDKTKKILKERWETGEIFWGKGTAPVFDYAEIDRQKEAAVEIIDDMQRAITEQAPVVVPFTIAAPPAPDVSPYLEGIKERDEAEKAHVATLEEEEAAIKDIITAVVELQARQAETREGWIVDYPLPPEIVGPQPDIFQPATISADKFRESIESTTLAVDELVMELEDVPDMIMHAAEGAEGMSRAFEITAEDIGFSLTSNFGNAMAQMVMDAGNATANISNMFKNLAADIISMIARAAMWKLVAIPLFGLEKGGEFTGAMKGLEFVGAQRGLEAVGGQYMRDTLPVMITRGEVVSPSPHVERVEKFMEEQEGEGGGNTYYITPFITGSVEEQLEFGGYAARRREAFGKFEVEGIL